MPWVHLRLQLNWFYIVCRVCKKKKKKKTVLGSHALIYSHYYYYSLISYIFSNFSVVFVHFIESDCSVILWYAFRCIESFRHRAKRSHRMFYIGRKMPSTKQISKHTIWPIWSIAFQLMLMSYIICILKVCIVTNLNLNHKKIEILEPLRMLTHLISNHTCFCVHVRFSRWRSNSNQNIAQQTRHQQQQQPHQQHSYTQGITFSLTHSHSHSYTRHTETENEREQCYVVPAVMSFAASFYPCHSIVSRIERPLLCKQQILLIFAALKGTGILSVLR